MFDDTQSLDELSRSQRLQLILQDSTRYIELMDERHVDMLLSKLAKTRGLTPEDLASEHDPTE